MSLNEGDLSSGKNMIENSKLLVRTDIEAAPLSTGGAGGGVPLRSSGGIQRDLIGSCENRHVRRIKEGVHVYFSPLLGPLVVKTNFATLAGRDQAAAECKLMRQYYQSNPNIGCEMLEAETAQRYFPSCFEAESSVALVMSYFDGKPLDDESLRRQFSTSAGLKILFDVAQSRSDGRISDGHAGNFVLCSSDLCGLQVFRIDFGFFDHPDSAETSSLGGSSSITPRSTRSFSTLVVSGRGEESSRPVAREGGRAISPDTGADPAPTTLLERVDGAAIGSTRGSSSGSSSAPAPPTASGVPAAQHLADHQQMSTWEEPPSRPVARQGGRRAAATAAEPAPTALLEGVDINSDQTFASSDLDGAAIGSTSGSSFAPAPANAMSTVRPADLLDVCLGLFQKRDEVPKWVDEQRGRRDAWKIIAERLGADLADSNTVCPGPRSVKLGGFSAGQVLERISAGEAEKMKALVVHRLLESLSQDLLVDSVTCPVALERAQWSDTVQAPSKLRAVVGAKSSSTLLRVVSAVLEAERDNEALGSFTVGQVRDALWVQLTTGTKGSLEVIKIGVKATTSAVKQRRGRHLGKRKQHRAPGTTEEDVQHLLSLPWTPLPPQATALLQRWLGSEKTHVRQQVVRLIQKERGAAAVNGIAADVDDGECFCLDAATATYFDSVRVVNDDHLAAEGLFCTKSRKVLLNAARIHLESSNMGEAEAETDDWIVKLCLVALHEYAHFCRHFINGKEIGDTHPCLGGEAGYALEFALTGSEMPLDVRSAGEVTTLLQYDGIQAWPSTQRSGKRVRVVG